MVLLLSLFVLLAIVPFLGAVENNASLFAAQLVFGVVFSIMLCIAVVTVAKTRTTIIAAGLLGGTAIVLVYIKLVTNQDTVAMAKHLVTSLFMGYIAVLTLMHIFQTRQVTANTLCASLCVYVILALFWAQLYLLVQVIDPATFAVSHVTERPDEIQKTTIAIYYSFVTVTTLGYGDVLPLTSVSRMLAVLEALIGQIYLVVLVARLVGLHIAQAKD
jgi:hypothetical protein